MRSHKKPYYTQIATAHRAADKQFLSAIVVAFMLLAVSFFAQANEASTKGMLGLTDEVSGVESVKSAETYLSIADDLLDQQRFSQALSYYTKVIHINRQIDAAFLGRSIAYGGIGRNEEAIADLNVYILRNPKDSMAYVYRGVRYMSQGATEAAERNLIKAVQIDPKNAQAYDDLGVLYAQQGRVEFSLKYFGQALRIDPYNEMAYHNLAIAYFLLDDNRRALGAVDRAIRLAPESRDTYILKAQILDALGKVDEAKKVRHYAQFLNEPTWTESVSVN